MNLRHLVFPILLAVLLPVKAATPATSAAEVLRQAETALMKAPSVEAAFSATRGNSSSSGKIIMSGNRFRLDTPEMSTWFDGRTQWSYSPAAGEVNISEPTPDELQQINPFAIIKGLQSDFTPRRISAPKGFDRLELIPSGKSEFLKVCLTLNSATHFPEEISVISSDRTVTAIKINSIRQGKVLDADAFRFNTKMFPGVDVVDLR